VRFISLFIAFVAIVAAVSPAGADERCGTWTRIGVQAAPGAETAVRPGPGTYQLGSSHFIVHYEDNALDGYAQNVSDAAELAWRVLVDTLNYDVPPTDGVAGGDGRVDLYLRDPAQMSGAWGITTPETFVGSPYPGTWTAYVEIVDTLSLDRLHVVTAHEFFHVIHIAYDTNEMTSFLEMIGTWAEDRVYDDANLYLDVLPNFFNQPQRNIYSFVYSNVPWMIYLTESYGDGILRDILDVCATVSGPNVTDATDAALAPYGSSEIDAFTGFTLWNYLTGARDDGAHYSEGASFPPVRVEKRTECYPLPAYMPLLKMSRLGSTYFFFDGNGATDALEVTVDPQNDANTVYAIHRFKDGIISTATVPMAAGAAPDSALLADWSECDSVLVISHVESVASSSARVEVSSRLLPQAPPTSPYVLILDRDDCRRPFDGVGDEFAPRDGEETPLADALAFLGVDYLQSDSIPSDLSWCGGVFVVGGHDGSGTTLADAEFDALAAFMDSGGDVYVEGNELGHWIDPGAGGGSASANAFWAYFGCDFVDGNSAATGNVSSWHTLPLGALPGFDFVYDYQDDPDDNVGSLVPTAADTLVVDQGGVVRASVHQVAGSARIMSTVLLGGSTGERAAFVDGVIELFDSIVAALAVHSMTVEREGDRVHVSGELSGYNGETLRLKRLAGKAVREIPVTVSGTGDRVRIDAFDYAMDGTVVYRLEAVGASGGEWLLWQQSWDGRVDRPPLAVAAVYPNPASGPVSLAVETDRPGDVAVVLYNVAGQRVLTRRFAVGAGTATLVIDEATRLASGVYFVRVTARGYSAHRKLHILR
jgi:hypothetical protein